MPDFIKRTMTIPCSLTAVIVLPLEVNIYPGHGHMHLFYRACRAIFKHPMWVHEFMNARFMPCIKPASLTWLKASVIKKKACVICNRSKQMLILSPHTALSRPLSSHKSQACLLHVDSWQTAQISQWVAIVCDAPLVSDRTWQHNWQVLHSLQSCQYRKRKLLGRWRHPWLWSCSQRPCQCSCWDSHSSQSWSCKRHWSHRRLCWPSSHACRWLQAAGTSTCYVYVQHKIMDDWSEQNFI